MAPNTISFYSVLFAVARDIGKLNSGVITTYTSATSMACVGIANTDDSAFNGAVARVMGGSTYATVSAYTGATRTFTLAGAGLTTATGARLEWVFYDADMFAAVFDSFNEMVRGSWGTWSRETVVDRSTATITLAANTHSYALPSACAQLLQIGLQQATTDTIQPIEALGIWRVEGQEGAFTLRFLPGYDGGGSATWSSRVNLGSSGGYGSFADAWSGQPLCLRYLEREPEITTEAGTTQLPLDYAHWATTAAYVTTYLANASPNTSRVLSTFLPQVQQNALLARGRLARTKPTAPPPLTLDW